MVPGQPWCRINNHDCREKWTLNKTIAGTCLEYDARRNFLTSTGEFKLPKRVTLTLSMGYNFSLWCLKIIILN